MPQNNKPGRRLLRRLYGSWYRVRRNISAFARWCLFAVIIGVVVGAVGAAFEHALEWATETRQEYSWTFCRWSVCLSRSGTVKWICRLNAAPTSS